MEYDLFDPAVHADPDRHFAALRDQCPVHHHVWRDFYTVSRTEDITRILRSPEVWSSRFRNGLAVPCCRWLTDAARRRPADAHLAATSRAEGVDAALIRALEPRVRQHVDELLEPVMRIGRADFHDVLSAQLPVRMIAELVGVPDQDREQFKAWSDARVEATAGTLGTEEAETVATAELAAYFHEHVATRRRSLTRGDEVPDDYTTMVLGAQYDGRSLSDHEVGQVLQLLMIGGIETTTLLLGNLLHRIITEPLLAEQLRGHPRLYEAAVEESLRLDSPTLGLFRTPNETCPVGDVDIPRDAKTMVLFAAVNRDPALWDRPHEFRLDRDVTTLRRHYAFGHGIHLCLGAPLARLEGRVVLEAIVERLPAVRYEREPRRTSTMIFRGYDRQPIAWDAG